MEKEENGLFICGECLLGYTEREWAEKCEN